MIKLICFLLLSLTMVVHSSADSCAYEDKNRCLFPYFGVDGRAQFVKFRNGYGNNTLKHNSTQGNIYLGLRINDYFAIESGYESTVSRSRTVTLFAGDMAAGTPMIEMVCPAVFKSKFKIEGAHLNLVGLLPIYNYCCQPIELLASVGTAFLKGTSKRETISVAGMFRGVDRTMVGARTVLRATLGLQYLPGDHVGLRGTACLLDTSKLIVSANDGMPGLYHPEIKPKRIVSYGLGVFYEF